jgi:hypothetical protein
LDYLPNNMLDASNYLARDNWLGTKNLEYAFPRTTKELCSLWRTTYLVH